MIEKIKINIYQIIWNTFGYQLFLSNFECTVDNEPLFKLVADMRMLTVEVDLWSDLRLTSLYH